MPSMPEKMPANNDEAPDGRSAKRIAEQTDYDPHINRNTPNPVSNSATFVHLIKGAVGTGLLAMPKAFTHTGWLLGIFASIGVTTICTYAMLLLIHAQYVLCKRQKVAYITYPKAAKLSLEIGPQCLRCLARIAEPFVDTFLWLYQLGICSVYVVFMGNNLKQLVEIYFDTNWNVRLYMLLFFLPCCLIISVKDLKRLVPFSIVANYMMAFGIGSVFYYIFCDFGDADPDKRKVVLNRFEIPQFIAICFFALEAVGLIVSVERAMATPKSFVGLFGVFSISMVVVGFFYCTVGLFGYLRFGSDVGDSITYNLPEDEIVPKIVKMLFTLAVLISYGLQGYVIVDILWNNHFRMRYEGTDSECRYEYMLRYAIVFSSFVLAMSVPDLGIMIGLIGSLCLSLMGFVVPAIMDICVRSPDAYGRFNWRLICDMVLIMFGLNVLITGLLLNIMDLINK